MAQHPHVNLPSRQETITLWEERMAELHEAGDKKRGIEHLVEEDDDIMKDLRWTRRRIISHMNEKIRFACALQERHRSQLHDIERTIKCTSDLIYGENRMDLLKFPLEVQKLIWKFVFIENYPIEIATYKFCDRPSLEIMGTCRQMRNAVHDAFYGHNIFKVASANIDERDFVDEFNFRFSPPTRYLQRLELYINFTTHMPRLLELLKRCNELKELTIIIESIPRFHGGIDALKTLGYKKPSILEVVAVNIPSPSETCEEIPALIPENEFQRARDILLEVLNGKHYVPEYCEFHRITYYDSGDDSS